MTGAIPKIDQLLASALRGETCAWPDRWTGREKLEQIRDQILYHGIAGLLAEKFGRLEGWPSEIIERVREQAIAQAMWELRQRALLSDLLANLAQRGILAILSLGIAQMLKLQPTQELTKARPGSKSRR